MSIPSDWRLWPEISLHLGGLKLMRRYLVLGWLCTYSSLAFAQDPLLSELESLRNSLNLKDPSRPELTLRLADLYFNQAFGSSLPAQRLRAIQLYEEALSGAKGLFPLPNFGVQAKLRFQLARLQENTQPQIAHKLFEQVLDNPAVTPDLKRESALHLAEMDESQNKIESATHFFTLALDGCQTSDSCTYAHYRRAWLHYRSQRLELAIADLRQSLQDSKGQVREQAVRDYVLFLSQRKTDGSSELAEIEKIGEQFAKPELVSQLADSFFSAGNRPAGVLSLAHYDQRHPSLGQKIRLMEESIGNRDWNSFQQRLTEIQSGIYPWSSAQETLLSQKILRRVLVQLDGLASSESQHAKILQQSILAYLNLYPRDELRSKMLDGWIHAETLPEHKLTQLATWIAEEAAHQNKNEEIRLRKIRATLSEKASPADLIVELKALQNLLTGTEEARKYQYLYAKALYDQKNLSVALPLFVALAKLESPKTPPDSWAIQSQNLALDCYNQMHRFEELVQQAETWTKSKELLALANIHKNLVKELEEMNGYAERAELEAAVALGSNEKSLLAYEGLCYRTSSDASVRDRACKNLETVAVQTKHQASLVRLLESQQRYAELAVEYERMGLFAKAAVLREAGKGPKESLDAVSASLRIVLLYELANQPKEQKRVLLKAVSSGLTSQISEPVQNALLAYLRESHLVTEKMLHLPWTAALKQAIAESLAQEGSRSPVVRRLLASAKQSTGPGWNQIALEDLKALDSQQRKIKFYGKRSKALFDQRIQKLSHLALKAKTQLELADNAGRVSIAKLLESAYSDLGQEVLASPLPKDLPEDAVAGLQRALQEMATPFVNQAQGYAQLAQKQADQINLPLGAAPQKAPSEVTPPQALMEKLRESPDDATNLALLKDYYDQAGARRLAAYFQGRLESLNAPAKGNV